MYGRLASPAGTFWNCYVCAINGMHVVENRLLFSLQLTNQRSEGSSLLHSAQVYGNFGSFSTGAHDWQITGDTKLHIGKNEFTIDHCDSDFLKLTLTAPRTTYYFIAQKSRSYS